MLKIKLSPIISTDIDLDPDRKDFLLISITILNKNNVWCIIYFK